MNPHRTIPFDLVAVAKANRKLAIQGERFSMAATPENMNTAKRHSVYAADINTLAGLTQNNAAANSDVTLLLVMSIVWRYSTNVARGNENRLINAPEITMWCRVGWPTSPMPAELQRITVSQPLVCAF